jgi:alkylation response protein AidB-like acyl-CoA dehydrogenase
LRIATYAARSVLYRTARLVEENAEAAINEVMAAKVFCTEQAGFVADQAVQLASGGALVEGHPLERLYREVRSLRFTGGASDILRLNIARGRIEFDAGSL